MDNKGFIASSLIYSAFLAIMLYMVLAINNYIQFSNVKNKINEKAVEDVKNVIVSGNENASAIGKPFLNYFNEITGSYGASSTNIIEFDKAPQDNSCRYTVAYDRTVDNNLRYVGKNPCNYVTFNGETAGWRIVGLFKNIKTNSGNQNLIKIVRTTPIGEYALVGVDTKNYDYASSVLREELNSSSEYFDYANKTSYWYGANGWGCCTNGKYMVPKTAIFDHKKSIKSGYSNSIETVTWNTGGIFSDDNRASKYYENERGTTVRKNTADKWTGKVGLLYPSDYGYAFGGTNDVRNKCMKRDLNDISFSGECGSGSNTCYRIDNCAQYNWLNEKGITIITTTDDGASSDANLMLVIGYNVQGKYTVFKEKVTPAIYLKANTVFKGGSGTESDPYIID